MYGTIIAKDYLYCCLIAKTRRSLFVGGLDIANYRVKLNTRDITTATAKKVNSLWYLLIAVTIYLKRYI